MLPSTAHPEKKSGLAFWANRVLEECIHASAGFAADPVHDLRVAIRRCRSMADGFLSVDPDPAWKQMKRLAKPLFSSLGDLRDTQVMIEWVAKLAEPGDSIRETLTAELVQKETDLKSASQQALAAFDRKRWASLNAHLVKRSGAVPLEGAVFQLLALERWLAARELQRQALRNRSAAGYHQLRIGIKRFRYTVENFLPERHERWAKDLRQLQDALGEIHDLDVLRAIIRQHPGIAAEHRMRWQARIADERQKRLDLYREKMVGRGSLWNIWRADLPSGADLEAAAMEKLRTWAAFVDPDVAHSTLVTQFAMQIYDELLQCGTPCISGDGRRLLEAAAILHEVGRRQARNGHDAGHQKRGYRMVCKLAPPLGWSAEQMRSVAAVVRYHRGALPVGTDPAFVGLSAKRRSELMPLIGVLRLANSFDRAHDHVISRVRVQRQDGFFVIYAYGLQSLSRRAEQIARGRHLLETVCNMGILIRPMEAKTAARSRPAATRAAAVS